MGYPSNNKIEGNAKLSTLRSRGLFLGPYSYDSTTAANQYEIDQTYDELLRTGEIKVEAVGEELGKSPSSDGGGTQADVAATTASNEMKADAHG